MNNEELISAQNKTIRRQMAQLADLEAHYISMGFGLPPEFIVERLKTIEDQREELSRLRSENEQLRKDNEQGMGEN